MRLIVAALSNHTLPLHETYPRQLPGPETGPSFNTTTTSTHSQPLFTVIISPCSRHNVFLFTHPPGPLERPHPTIRHAPLITDHAIHHQRPALQLPRPSAAAAVGLFRISLLQLPLRGRPAEEPGRGAARRPVPPEPAVEADCQRWSGVGYCGYVS